MNWIKKHKFLTVVLAFIALMIIASAGGSDKQAATTQQAAPAQAATSEPAPAPQTKISLDEFYGKLQDGMSKAEVTALAGGREPSSCTEMEMEYVGKLDSCSYGGFMDAGMVMVQFTNDKLTSKSNSKF